MTTNGSAPIDCPYCDGSGYGQYWVHVLSHTVDCPCHHCDGMGRKHFTPEELADAIADLNEDREAAYRKRYPYLFAS